MTTKSSINPMPPKPQMLYRAPGIGVMLDLIVILLTLTDCVSEEQAYYLCNKVISYNQLKLERSCPVKEMEGSKMLKAALLLVVIALLSVNVSAQEVKGGPALLSVNVSAQEVKRGPVKRCYLQNQVWQDCGTQCPKNCENINEQGGFCIMSCAAKCFCRSPYIFKSGKSGACVLPKQCPGYMNAYKGR
ncbi:uncharacterized protein O3C94_014606 [Discoglossus pictus]